MQSVNTPSGLLLVDDGVMEKNNLLPGQQVSTRTAMALILANAEVWKNDFSEEAASIAMTVLANVSAVS